MSAKRTLTDREAALPALTEAFREHGFDGATLAILSKATGLGKGSLYNFFPGGKAEMMEAVLDNIDRWFANSIFAPLENLSSPAMAIASMFEEVKAYFQSGRRTCIVGSLGLNSSGAAFSIPIGAYFARWILALSRCLESGKVPPAMARNLAEVTVSGIQGAIVLTRALGDDAIFERVVDRLQSSLLDKIDRDG